ncbi:MAG: sn-glycerol-3-phosphate ABC transporter ATP-binding protein UgpC [Candidatus Muirbacterium halophilum]|nr:sn-glycerol-3-phosphate ABC transporter ATP-binding protein UgpC [Candidatus Muirbacterium halophilum]MCK9476628.1 sn-glycerol-3-phosphate ABC transporter ATP-binding protein UgpC [Candidatus Muirbacterium halophilum]
MARVTLKNLVKVYDGVKEPTIRNIDLDIKDKEFMVLVGPSGCGKSTTLRMIAGLEEITEGEIMIGEQIVNDLAPKDRDIAMVFQNYALYPHMSVYDNMAFALKLRKMAKDEIEKKVKDAAKILSIEDYLDRKPKALSGGQRQRVALGRAIVREPKVFLMDEPLSNLDAKLRVQMRAEIIKLHRKLDATIVYVTHDQIEAMTMGDRIAIFDKGVIEQCDTPAVVYSKPSNIFVASFIGSPSMNFIKGKFDGENLVVSENLKIPLLKKPEGLSLYKDKDVILGIRPEHIYTPDSSMSKVIEYSNEELLSVSVDVIEPMGNEKHCNFILDGKFLVVRLEPDVKTDYNETVKIFFNKEKLHFFDPATTKRI